jgi:hypothetical protein
MIFNFLNLKIDINYELVKINELENFLIILNKY